MTQHFFFVVRIFLSWLQIKRFINCRFSMTFWMLAGLSYTYSSYELHGKIDYGLLLSAVSQYLYLVKVRRTHTLTTSHCTPFYGFVTLYYYFDFCRLLNYSFPHYLLLLSYSFYSLVQFFEWEIGYMRSIDIIVDRAGWEIQWGCLVWVPSVYTLHSRFLVANPSGLSPLTAGAIFAAANCEPDGGDGLSQDEPQRGRACACAPPR